MSEFDFGGNDLEENVERVGGEWSADESGVYVKGITEAYLSQSKNGAYAMNLSTKDKEGNERKYVFYFTNKQGQVYYTKDKKKHQLPGYALLNAICMLTAGKSAQEILSKPKKKVIDLMDWESRKEVPTEVKSYPLICKKPLIMGIVKVVSNKWAKGKATNAKREQNELKMVFHPKTKLTITEIAAGATAESIAAGKDEPKLYAAWLKAWEGKIDDQFVEQEADEEIEDQAGDDPFGEDETDATDTQDSDDDNADSSEASTSDDDDDDMFA